MNPELGGIVSGSQREEFAQYRALEIAQATI
jgi:hypothetical protein